MFVHRPNNLFCAFLSSHYRVSLAQFHSLRSKCPSTQRSDESSETLRHVLIDGRHPRLITETRPVPWQASCGSLCWSNIQLQSVQHGGKFSTYSGIDTGHLRLTYCIPPTTFGTSHPDARKSLMRANALFFLEGTWPRQVGCASAFAQTSRLGPADLTCRLLWNGIRPTTERLWRMCSPSWRKARCVFLYDCEVVRTCPPP